MIQLKRGPYGEDLNSYIPSDGQAVYDSTNNHLKIGNGTTAFDDLPAIGIGGVSPNLLINSNMVGAINQRGSTSFSDMHTYTIDRWMLMYGSASYSSTNGMTLDDYSQICQYIEGLQGFVGKTFTLSAFIDGSVQTLTAQLSTSLIASGKLSFVYTNTGYCQVNVSGPGLVKWVKFEIGNTSTSCSPRLMGEELSLCQRYYTCITKDIDMEIGQLRTGASHNGAFYGYFPVVMRDNPNVIIYSSSGTANCVTMTGGTEIEILSVSTKVNGLWVDVGSYEIPANSSVYCFYTADAEIYA